MDTPTPDNAARATPFAWQCKTEYSTWDECTEEKYDHIVATGHYGSPTSVKAEARALVDAATVAALEAEVDRLNAIINTPQADDFLRAVSTEAEHQRQRWGSEHDSGKTPADWFWLVGYLAGKALHAHVAGDATKAEHHIITTAAALANWHLAAFGKTDMRALHPMRQEKPE